MYSHDISEFGRFTENVRVFSETHTNLCFLNYQALLFAAFFCQVNPYKEKLALRVVRYFSTAVGEMAK